MILKRILNELVKINKNLEVIRADYDRREADRQSLALEIQHAHAALQSRKKALSAKDPQSEKEEG